jgi:hypothetical protein
MRQGALKTKKGLGFGRFVCFRSGWKLLLCVSRCSVDQRKFQFFEKPRSIILSKKRRLVDERANFSEIAQSRNSKPQNWDLSAD